MKMHELIDPIDRFLQDAPGNHPLERLGAKMGSQAPFVEAGGMQMGVNRMGVFPWGYFLYCQELEIDQLLQFCMRNFIFLMVA